MTSRSLMSLAALVACGRDTTELPPDARTADASDPATGDAATDTCREATQRADFAFLQDQIFTPSCATARCHAGPEPEVGLDLAAGAAHANLVNKGASTVTGWTRVVPGSLATSYLVVALGRTEGPPPRDGFMPLGADPLCVEKLAAIERWILAGAPP